MNSLYIGIITGFLVGVLSMYGLLGTRRKRKQQNHLELLNYSKDLLYYYELKPKRQFKYVSPAANLFFGEGAVERAYEDPDLPFQRIHPDDEQLLKKKIKGELNYEEPIIQRWIDHGGNYRWYEDHATPIYKAGELVAVQGVVRNIDEKVRLQQELEYRVYHDSLTSIHNREFFERAMTTYDEEVDISVGIILCDLDQLKYYNDHFGHKVGDELIIETAKLLKHFANEQTIVARIGGDEFVLLMISATEAAVNNLMTQITTVIDEYNNSQNERSIQLSIGSAYHPHSFGQMTQLFAQADAQMYADKSERQQVMAES
ncbi:sensor domain-containing diguanylate cyclase [Bacillus sp. FJAT-42315]|uniref:sensor domain-containing diguanylate cyclase n=1 Tax=Bacillus sp. FJAT-42315 TaxID=2014077 RepID=UPI000C24FAE0|nr:sensor domain-containing diguanylate cyclase [Bacillus sp. FJAT-42315]